MKVKGAVVTLALPQAGVFYDKEFYVMGKVLSDELSCTWTGLVTKWDNFL